LAKSVKLVDRVSFKPSKEFWAVKSSKKK
jgi:hypothetical protein